MKNKKGSSIVLLAMVFVTMAACISASIGLARALVVKSECNTFGKLWARAILSEYDVHLIEDYGIMAYYGNEIEVQKRINSYLLYSCDSKLDARISDAEAFLSGYELNDPNNFQSSLKKIQLNSLVDSVVNAEGRTNREKPEDNAGSRKIANEVVIDTLPSKGIDNTLNIDTLVKYVKDGKSIESILKKLSNTALDITYMYKYLNSYMRVTGDKVTYFNNEWEYVIAGKLDDHANYNACRKRLFLLRNALNLAALYEDRTKVETIAAIAEILTPGAGAVTQVAIAEAWAAVETEEDLKDLYAGERVPLFKTGPDWKTDLNMALSDEEKEKVKDLIATSEESTSEIETMSEGLDYEEYLLIMLSSMNENTRVLRIMDIIQVNMKYRYYDDFNMSEYYVGVDFYINANGRQYEIKDRYK